MSIESAYPPVRVINGKKTFIPLENNPESLTRLSNLLHINDVTFHDIYSLDPIIQDDIPRPAHALIFIAPAPVYHKLWASNIERERHWSNTTTHTNSNADETKNSNPQVEDVNAEEDKDADANEDEDKDAGLKTKTTLSGPDMPVLWFKQTIGHACGFMSLLHAICNGTRDPQKHIPKSSPLSEILSASGELSIEPRAKLLYDSTAIEAAHMTAAAEGETYAPDPSEPNGMHFITFVKTLDGTLWELEGGNPGGPVKLASLRADEDVLCPAAVSAGPGRYIDVGRDIGIAEFSCVAMALW